MHALLAVGGGSSGGGGQGPGWLLPIFLVVFVLAAVFIGTAIFKRRSR